ncbi:putative zinc-type alcohol dehydrogenase-like protein YogA [Cyphellophora attinorum]|uniref:Putative zinc-type alcohol dehydrogenase-like protein YogA n=1 Tax=Cyphellophora attinorum TaxID=1664694 RepID=A0A0N0NPZ4_9EURO|nr:putative zinc-type alcohol dehydrogenase-like protein YogA [Phialophora attinorum]KPI43331.1 putative zinc-type alcohol dehydrogenase-like protein YogA [Phialophora attinorum]
MPKAITISQVDGKPGQVYYPLQITTVPNQTPSANQLLIKISAAALNHRDLFIRQHLYPGLGFGIPLLADGCGTVTSTGSSAAAKAWAGKRVVVNPGTGWDTDPEGPEDKTGYKILGGTKMNPNGTLQEYMLVEASEVEEAPSHLSDVENAAIPLTGLTAWRAVMVKCGPQNLKPGKNILVTGIGGGVALCALEFARAAGANVFVTSGSQEKIDKAIKLGAKGGVNYKEKDWDKKLKELLPKENKNLDCIVDGAGGDVVSKGAKLLKNGGIISIYGMTVSPKMDFLMQAVLKNIEVKGSTMGSRKEFKDMIDFVKRTSASVPVSRVVKWDPSGDDIKDVDGLFEDMKKASQFGKLVIEITGSSGGESKL